MRETIGQYAKRRNIPLYAVRRAYDRVIKDPIWFGDRRVIDLAIHGPLIRAELERMRWLSRELEAVGS